MTRLASLKRLANGKWVADFKCLISMWRINSREQPHKLEESNSHAEAGVAVGYEQDESSSDGCGGGDW